MEDGDGLDPSYGQNGKTQAAGNGGSGEVVVQNVTVTPGMVVSVIVGAGGARGEGWLWLNESEYEMEGEMNPGGDGRR